MQAVSEQERDYEINADATTGAAFVVVVVL